VLLSAPSKIYISFPPIIKLKRKEKKRSMRHDEKNPHVTPRTGRIVFVKETDREEMTENGQFLDLQRKRPSNKK